MTHGYYIRQHSSRMPLVTAWCEIILEYKSRKRKNPHLEINVHTLPKENRKALAYFKTQTLLKANWKGIIITNLHFSRGHLEKVVLR